MSQNGGKGGGRQKGRPQKNRYKIGQRGGEILQTIDENNKTLSMFKDIGTALDYKHDKYERIVKLSRDVTIESKRIIFLLHSTATDVASKKEDILHDASNRLKQLSVTNFKSIAQELNDIDPYPYHRAYGGGLEEFVEAALFYNYIKSGNRVGYEELDGEYFHYNEDGTKLLFSVVDFVLGLADFTGEMMRKSINSLSSGQLDECFKTLALVREIQVGFMGINLGGARGVSRKFYTLSQSVSKMEQVCYTLSVRGNEIPTGTIIDVINQKERHEDDDVDEGIF